MSYENMEFKSIDKRQFLNILSRLTNYLNKLGIKRTVFYTSAFTFFLKYLDENNIDFKDISQSIVLNHLEILSKTRKISFKKVIVFLIKEGYLSRDNFTKYNTDKSKVDYYFNEFLIYLQTSGRRKQTIFKHRKNLKRFFSYLELKEKVYLNNITKDILEEYMFELYSSTSKRNKKKLATSTLIEYILSVKLYFRYLARENYIIYDPAIFLKLPKSERRITTNYFTLEEIKKVFNEIKLDTLSKYRMKVLFETMYNLGLRVNEALHLKLEDINFDTGIVHIKEGKGGYDRSIPMSNYIKKYLKIYIDNAYYNHFENKDGYLFFNPKTKKIISATYYFDILLKNIVKKLGIKKNISSHAFRKSIGKHLLEKGLDIRYVQKFLGHRCINATQSYTILNIDDLKEALERYHPREIKKEEYIKKSKYKG